MKINGFKNQNQKNTGASSGEKNGSLTTKLPEFRQIHKMISFSGAEKQRISSKIIELYNKGLSIRDISKQVGKAGSTINSILRKAGIELRTNKTLPFKESRRASGKGIIRPPYGFCYFQGKVVPDQKEYENLLLIYPFNPFFSDNYN